MKKLMLTAALGLGIGLSGTVSADRLSTCEILERYCAAGHQTACLNYNRSC